MTSPAPDGLRIAARPWRVIVGAVIVTVVFCAGSAIGWVALPRSLRIAFGPFQIATLLAILGALLLAVWLLAVSSVHADPRGVRIRNGLRRHRFGWGQVAAVRFRTGDPLARLVLHERVLAGHDAGDRRVISCFGLPSWEGRSTLRAVERLRRLHDSHGESHGGGSAGAPDTSPVG